MRFTFAHIVQKRTAEGWVDLDVPGFGPYRDDEDFMRFFGLTTGEPLVAPVAPVRGAPADDARAEEFEETCDDCSHVAIEELLAYDYDGTFVHRRTSARPAPEVGGVTTGTVGELLGPAYFADLERLRAAGADRVIFGFAFQLP